MELTLRLETAFDELGGAQDDSCEDRGQRACTRVQWRRHARHVVYAGEMCDSLQAFVA